MNIFALQLPEVKRSLQEAACLISDALAESITFDISAQTESLELLAEVLHQASGSFYMMCSDAADCQGCFLSRDIVPALTGLLDCATMEVYALMTQAKSTGAIIDRLTIHRCSDLFCLTAPNLLQVPGNEQRTAGSAHGPYAVGPCSPAAHALPRSLATIAAVLREISYAALLVL